MQVDLDHIFKVAKEAAERSQCRYNVSCVLVDKRGDVVSIGINHWSSNRPKMGRRTVHAELDAIRGIKKMKESNLYAFIYRCGAGGATRNINCCDACKSLLRAYGIEKIFYMTENEEWVRA